MPFFNRQNNDDLILAIQVAGMSSGRNGFRKDKGGEKTCRIGSHRLAAFVACGEKTLLEHRTDGTDAFSPMRSKLLRGQYALHQLRKIPVSRRFLAVDEWRIINFLFLLSVLQVA